MKTFEVPATILVQAESTNTASATVLSFLEYALDIGNDERAITQCLVATESEVRQHAAGETVTSTQKSFAVIRHALAQMVRGEFDMEQASANIAAGTSKESLAAFIVDAFALGWISKRDLGVADDSNVI